MPGSAEAARRARSSSGSHETASDGDSAGHDARKAAQPSLRRRESTERDSCVAAGSPRLQGGESCGSSAASSTASSSVGASMSVAESGTSSSTAPVSAGRVVSRPREPDGVWSDTSTLRERERVVSLKLRAAFLFLVMKCRAAFLCKKGEFNV